MIDELSADRTGWARFSDDRHMRYRLARALTPLGLDVIGRDHAGDQFTHRVVFLMLNPSTADAFVLDPTVRKCVQFAQRWQADVLEVVNLFAMRSPYPKDLLKWAAGMRGDDAINDESIVTACTQPGRTITIAAWGNHGKLDDRHVHVRKLLAKPGGGRGPVQVWHLGTTQDGFPKHPLARGLHFIPLDTVPEVFA